LPATRVALATKNAPSESLTSPWGHLGLGLARALPGCSPWTREKHQQPSSVPTPRIGAVMMVVVPTPRIAVMMVVDIIPGVVELRSGQALREAGHRRHRAGYPS
jgi:hypothetical protein